MVKCDGEHGASGIKSNIDGFQIQAAAAEGQPTALRLRKEPFVSRSKELSERADHFASRAVRARGRTARNTYLSLEQSYRSLATQQERFEAAGRELSGVEPDASERRAL